MQIFYRFVKILSVCLIALFGVLSAQEFQFERKINPFAIKDMAGTSYDLALTGGMNRPVHQFVDINGDNAPDLFVQDRASLLTYFENVGTAMQHQFQWKSDQFGDMEIGEWFKFADVDQDGDFDLFAEKPFGIIRYYRNEGDAQNPQFTLAADPLTDVGGASILSEGFSIPEWADIDCDTDLDLFLGRLNGSVSFFRHIGLDLNDVPLYEHVTDTFQGLVIVTGGGEPASQTAPEIMQRNNMHKSESGRHGANSLTFIDIDNDMDNDLFWGDFFATSVIYLKNDGNCTTANIDLTAEMFPPASPLGTGGYNVPRFTDINGDGDYDMFVGVLGGASSFILDRAENFYYYENIGVANQPDFVLRTKQFINSIDFGRNTVPALVDIDADGDLDLFLSAEEDLDSPSHANSRLYFYENEPVNGQPAFQLMDTHYLNYDKLYDLNYSPTFVDIDNDQDYDLMIGKWDGKMTLFRNDGDATSPNFVVGEENYMGLDIGFNNTPVFVDIDADNDPDLFVGEFTGNLNFFRNVGSLGAPAFQLDTTHYFGIDVGSFSAPFFEDVDGDQDYDLFIGSDLDGIYFYRNEGSPQNANFVLDTAFDLPLHLRTSPRFADIDNDGDVDLISGADGGGLIYYENQEIMVPIEPVSPVNQPVSIQLLKNYPNPFNPNTTVEYELALPENLLNGQHSLKIYNLLGQLVREWQFANDQLNIRRTVDWNGQNAAGQAVQSGIYFYELSLDNQTRMTGKMLLTR